MVGKKGEKIERIEANVKDVRQEQDKVGRSDRSKQNAGKDGNELGKGWDRLAKNEKRF